MPDTPTYIIANLTITDPVEYQKYTQGFLSVLHRYGGEFITVDDDPETLDGASPLTGRIVILRFPSEASAREWYASEEYQALSLGRKQGAQTAFVTLVRGLSRPPAGTGNRRGESQ